MNYSSTAKTSQPKHHSVEAAPRGIALAARRQQTEENDMSSLDYATDLQRQAFMRRQPVLPRSLEGIRFDPETEFGILNEAETNEFAARLLDTDTEADFDHLLGAIVTHAAMKTGGSLPAPLGSALGGYLKRIARESRLDPVPGQTLGLELEGLDELEQEFESNLQFVRLAGEAARHATETVTSAPPQLAALAALVGAAELYAPSLLTEQAESEDEIELSPETEFFTYDPEMEYFLGGLIHSATKIVKGVANTVSKAANAVGKIPILGDISRAGIGALRLSMGPAAMAIDAGARLARGQKLGDALKGAVMGQVDAVRDQLKLAEMVAPFIPGIGTGVGAALGAANALAAGRPITEAIFAAARAAIPGGRIAQAAFDTAKSLAEGKNITEALLTTARNQLPGGPAARAAFDGAIALAQGKKLQDAAFAAAGRILPPSPYAADALSFIKGVANGQNIQTAALSVIGKRAVQATRGQAALLNPTMRLVKRAVVLRH
jgi:hypothetical protein